MGPLGNDIYLMRHCAGCVHIAGFCVVNCQLKKEDYLKVLSLIAAPA